MVSPLCLCTTLYSMAYTDRNPNDARCWKCVLCIYCSYISYNRWNDLFSLFCIFVSIRTSLSTLSPLFLFLFPVFVDTLASLSICLYILPFLICISHSHRRSHLPASLLQSVCRIVHISCFDHTIPGQDHTTIHCRCFSVFLLIIYIHTYTHRSPTH